MPARTKKAAAAPAQLRLGPKLDHKSAIALAEDLRASRGADLCLDAQATTLFGTPAVQVILAAGRTWARDGFRLSISGVSDTCLDQLRLLGFTPETLVEGALP